MFVLLPIGCFLFYDNNNVVFDLFQLSFDAETQTDSSYFADMIKSQQPHGSSAFIARGQNTDITDYECNVC